MPQRQMRGSTLRTSSLANTSLFRRSLPSSSSTLSSISSSLCLRAVILSVILIQIVFVVTQQHTLFRSANLEACATNQRSPIKSTTTRISQHTNETIVICAIAKHETPYIDEWADYNLGLGFAAIYVYDNTDRYELQQWGPKRQQQNDPIHVFHQPGWSSQCKAYWQCAALAIEQNHTWAFFADIDEFLILKQHVNVADFAHDYIHDGQLALNWQIFGTSNQYVYQPIPVTKRFQLRTEKTYTSNQMMKSIVKLSDFNFNGPCYSPHDFPLKRGWRRTTDGHIWFRYMYVYGPTDVAYINHYYFKSFEENIAKRSRGAGYHGKKVLKQYVNDALQYRALNGQPIPNGTIFDDTAWQDLKRMVPKYEIFDSFANE